MAKARDVYAKLQKDLDVAKRERQALNLHISQAEDAVGSTDRRVASFVTDLLPLAERVAPTIFKEKTRLETEAMEAIATRERALFSFTGAYDEAAKIYRDLDAAHASFESAENRRLNANADYGAALNAINGYDEAETRAQIDDLTAHVEKQDKKLGDHWLIRAAYHNQYGQEGYKSQHFVQDLFGMLCLKVKKTRRYNSLIREIEYASKTLANAQAKAKKQAAAASNATIVVNRMMSDTRTLIETHAKESEHQKTIVDTAELAMNRERQALGNAKAQDKAIKAWTHPVAKKAKDNFQKILIGSSDASARFRATLASQKASIIRDLMKEIEKKSEINLTLSNFESERKTLSDTIDRLESLSRDMRRKGLSSSSREIAKADDFMAGSSDDGFDLSTLVAVTVSLDAVIDATPQDTSISSSSFSNDSYSSSSFE